MKKTCIAILISFPLLLSAQESPLNEFFDTYSGKEGYTSITISNFMFQLFSKVASENDKEFSEVTSKLESIKLLTIDSVENTKVKFYEELVKHLPGELYKELMVIKDGNETVRFLIRESKDKISEFVMTVDGAGEAVVIFLEGDIDLNQISKLSSTMNIEGFEHLDKVAEE